MKIKFKTLILASFFSVLCSLSSFSSPASFTEAKKIANTLFRQHQETLYCGCKYNENKEVDLASCNMQTASGIKRAHRIEWEHMMPAENFGRHFVCWQEAICHKDTKRFKGRKCCEQIDELFNQAEAELYNLWPAVGLVNQARSNYRFAQLDNKTIFYGCNFAIDKDARKVEPADSAKGIVARANLFMSDKYDVPLSSSQRKLFNAWNKQFPPSEWEKQWAKAVREIEGYSNPYIQMQ